MGTLRKVNKDFLKTIMIMDDLKKKTLLDYYLWID